MKGEERGEAQQDTIMSLPQLPDGYLITRGAQGRVQYCSVFSHIQMLPSKHLIDLAFQVGRTGQIPEQLQYTSSALKIDPSIDKLNIANK